jgi:hypothetical protein
MSSCGSCGERGILSILWNRGILGSVWILWDSGKRGIILYSQEVKVTYWIGKYVPLFFFAPHIVFALELL